MVAVARAQDSLLARSAHMLVQWRHALEKAGYPFREPPGGAQLIADIDAAAFPDARCGTRAERRAEMRADLDVKPWRGS